MKLRITECALRLCSGQGLRIVTVCMLIAGPSLADEVYTKNKKGNELYKKGDYAEALKQYDDAQLLAPADTLLKMNRGAALYRLGKLDDAEAEYSAALSQKNKKKQADAHYNLGNIQFRQGDALSQSGGQGAMEKYKSALDHYIKALDMQQYSKDAKWNIELAQRRIKMQEQQQQQNKQDQQNKDDKQNKDNKDQQNQDKQQDKDKKDQQDKKDQDKKDQEKKDQEKDKQDQQKQNQEQQPQPQPQQSKEEMKKQEAKRLIEQFADDADSLNKPPKKKGMLLKMKKPEKDW